jgi:outer membrane protein assembly factor BamB
MAEPPEEPPGGRFGDLPEDPPAGRGSPPPEDESRPEHDDEPLPEHDDESLPEHDDESLSEHDDEPLPEHDDEPIDQPTGELYGAPTGELFDEYDDDPYEDESEQASGRDLLGDLGQEVHSATELAQRRAQERAERRRAGRRRLLILIAGLVVLVVVIVLATSGGGGAPAPTPTETTSPLAAAGSGPGYLQTAAASSSALPDNILVADRNNDRLVAITPRGRVVWTERLAGPSDAFPSRTGRSITVTQPGSFVVAQLAVADLYRYGRSGTPGSSDNRLADPQTAQELSDGQIVIADRTNCRILFLRPPSHRPVTTLGTPGSCLHDPPRDLGYPDAVFPATGGGGGVVATEADPAWVDLLNSAGAVTGEVRLPSTLRVPDDANEYAPGEFIATSHSLPGAVEEFDSAGKVTWSYGPSSGPGELDKPSLAERLPDGNVLVSDSGDDRIVVIDAGTHAIVWQYGHTHHPGSRPGYLHTPDSAVLVASTVG